MRYQPPNPISEKTNESGTEMRSQLENMSRVKSGSYDTSKDDIGVKSQHTEKPAVEPLLKRRKW